MDIEQTLTTIRASLASDATAAARAAGATACRSILAALEPAPVPAMINPTAIASALTALRGIPPDQLLDLAIAKLRGALPVGAQIAPACGFKMPFVPTPFPERG
jgi:hypothetical protein